MDAKDIWKKVFDQTWRCRLYWCGKCMQQSPVNVIGQREPVFFDCQGIPCRDYFPEPGKRYKKWGAPDNGFSRDFPEESI